MSEQEQRCETCLFHVLYKLDGSLPGECRRRAPTPSMVGQLDGEYYERPAQSIWPDVDLTDWCGEWKAKPCSETGA